MARWVALFEDHPREIGDPIRKNHSQAHFDYLAEHSDRILIGGGLRPNPDEWYCGGLWVIEVETREDAIALIENDPYFTLGLRKGYRLMIWGKAPNYGAVTL
jgi:uncharacterized protein YciI